jgi:hypothetical protein
MGFDGKMGLGMRETRRLQVVRDAVAQTVSIARLTQRTRDRVGDELVRLGALQELAALTPMAWRVAAGERREELSFWLFNVAIGLAATGEHGAGLALLDALPCVPAGAQGRRELMTELCAQDARMAA